MVSYLYLANPRGFCFGVERAVQVAKQSLALYKELYVIEDVVHNKRVMNELQELGIKKVASVADVPSESSFMISAHGMSPQAIAQINSDVNIIDGTCPIVKVIQKMIERDHVSGKKIVVIGKRDHAEIIGYLGFADNENIYVVFSEIDIELLPSFEGELVSCYSQTTLTQTVVNDLFVMLKRKVPHIEVGDAESFNRCRATQCRQDAVIEMISNKKIDMMIIAGSQTSSNSKALVQVAIDNGVENSILVDDVSELTSEMFCEIDSVGITSGASCPEIVVQEIIEYIKSNINSDVIIEEFGTKDDCQL